jgi:membrane-bound serine protease (ClpP class)
LALTAGEAERAHIADAIAPDLTAALRLERLGGPREYAAYTWGEEVARFATSPEVSGLLLSIGVLGLLIEMQTLHGIAGLIGVSALALFFGTHVYAGFSNSLVVGLALLGVIGILLELHVVPGHGVSGILGMIALVSAVVLAFGFAFFFVAAQAISIAIVLSAIFFALSTRVFPESAFMKRIVLSAAQGPEYVASLDHRELLGQRGHATSFLRPAGVASFGGQRVDVLTEGDFVSAGSPIRVTRVEGARIFVQPVSEE